MKNQDRGILAAELFLKGYNCAQAVAIAFCDVTGLDEAMTARLSSSFGGGLGRLREVCGAVSGMAMVAGVLYGSDDPKDDEAKKAHYELIQQLAGEFRNRMGTIICRELLDNPPSDPTPSPRTAEYYANRPCARFVMVAAEILNDYIQKNPPQK
jgi:C_GCAxxG_C_C family probable redox protein